MELLYGEISNHYELFYKSNCKPVNLCPFCGLERYSNPKNGREDYDHYLYQKNYPLLRINFDNLVPMPSICNGNRVKHVQDVLINGTTGQPRLAYYPYHNVSTYNSVITCRDMFGSSETWSITLNVDDETNNEKFETWKTVFKIETRYALEIADNYQAWILELVNRNSTNSPTDVGSFNAAISDQIHDLNTRAVVPGQFLHKLFWVYILSTDDLVKEQILFFMDQQNSIAV